MLADQYIIHETEANRARQTWLLEAFRAVKYPNSTLLETPREVKSSVDGTILTGIQTQAILEGKCRNGRPYSTWAVEIAKTKAGYEAASVSGVPFFFLFAWDENRYYLDMTLAKVFVEASMQGWMQRGDRDELADLCYYIDRGMFTSF